MKEYIIKPKTDGTARVLLSSDIHCNDLQTWYGISNAERMQHWVDSVRLEHEKHPIDLLLLLGDFSLDHWMYGGQWLKTGKSGTEEFFADYLSQITDIPYAAVSGNHEQFGPALWQEKTGCDTESVVVLGNTVFVLLDTFSGDLDPDHDHDGCYVPQDPEKLKAVLSRCSGKSVYLASHWFDAKKESADFCALVADTPEIKGMFVGHSHYSTPLDLPEVFGSKKIAQTGNFSYTAEQDTAASFWGFRDLLISDEEDISEYIVAESSAAPTGTPEKIPYQRRNRVVFSKKTKGV